LVLVLAGAQKASSLELRSMDSRGRLSTFNYLFLPMALLLRRSALRLLVLPRGFTLFPGQFPRSFLLLPGRLAGLTAILANGPVFTLGDGGH
jgi:hypothetical protein